MPLGGLAGSLLGRRIYEAMRYWNEDQADWDATEHAFAAAWRAQPKWVVSATLKSVCAKATLVGGSVEDFVPKLKANVDGDINVSGPSLAGRLTYLGLIDEYWLYLRPFVLGGGKPYFANGQPPLRLMSADSIGEETVKLIHVPALIAWVDQPLAARLDE